MQKDLVRARVLVSNAESLLVTSCPFQVKTLTDHAPEDIQEDLERRIDTGNESVTGLKVK